MRWSERNQKIVDAVRGGRSASDVGREYGLTRERVRQICQWAGITIRFELERRNDERKAGVIEKLKTGMSITELVRAENLPLSLVQKWAREENLFAGKTPNQRSYAVSKHRYHVIADLLKGVDPVDICKRLNISRQTVYQVASGLRQAGIKLPNYYAGKPRENL